MSQPVVPRRRALSARKGYFCPGGWVSMIRRYCSGPVPLDNGARRVLLETFGKPGSECVAAEGKSTRRPEGDPVVGLQGALPGRASAHSARRRIAALWRRAVPAAPRFGVADGARGASGWAMGSPGVRLRSVGRVRTTAGTTVIRCFHQTDLTRPCGCRRPVIERLPVVLRGRSHLAGRVGRTPYGASRLHDRSASSATPGIAIRHPRARWLSTASGGWWPWAWSSRWQADLQRARRGSIVVVADANPLNWLWITDHTVEERCG